MRRRGGEAGRGGEDGGRPTARSSESGKIVRMECVRTEDDRRRRRGAAVAAGRSSESHDQRLVETGSEKHKREKEGKKHNEITRCLSESD